MLHGVDARATDDEERDEDFLVRFLYGKCYPRRITGDILSEAAKRRPRTIVRITKRGDTSSFPLLDSRYDVEMYNTPAGQGAPAHEEYGTTEEDHTIICGRTTAKDSNQKVQLILCSTRRTGFPIQTQTPVMKVTSFYATHVQCFISGWCAVQLFPDMSQDKKAYLWDDRGEPLVDAAVEKYEKRGYTFIPYDKSYVFPNERRSVQDGSALYIGFERMYEEELGHDVGVNQLFYMLKKGLDMLSWFVNNNRILTLSMDDELAAVRALTPRREELFINARINEMFGADRLRTMQRRGDLSILRRMMRSGILRIGSSDMHARQLL
jgi:hypothetical protein